MLLAPRLGRVSNFRDMLAAPDSSVFPADSSTLMDLRDLLAPRQTPLASREPRPRCGDQDRASAIVSLLAQPSTG